MDVFGKDLSDKLVMLKDGSKLGTLYNVEVDSQSGAIKAILLDKGVENERVAQVPFPQERDGLYRIPAEKVGAIEDYVVVSN